MRWVFSNAVGNLYWLFIWKQTIFMNKSTERITLVYSVTLPHILGFMTNQVEIHVLSLIQMHLSHLVHHIISHKVYCSCMFTQFFLFVSFLCIFNYNLSCLDYTIVPQYLAPGLLSLFFFFLCLSLLLCLSCQCVSCRLTFLVGIGTRPVPSPVPAESQAGTSVLHQLITWT